MLMKCLLKGSKNLRSITTRRLMILPLPLRRSSEEVKIEGKLFRLMSYLKVCLVLERS